jgi:hypothetical protein
MDKEINRLQMYRVWYQDFDHLIEENYGAEYVGAVDVQACIINDKPPAQALDSVDWLYRINQSGLGPIIIEQPTTWWSRIKEWLSCDSATSKPENSGLPEE